MKLDPYILSINVNRLRAEHGWSMRELASMASVNRNTLSMINQAKLDSPRISTLKRIAAAFNVDVSDLLKRYRAPVITRPAPTPPAFSTPEAEAPLIDTPAMLDVTPVRVPPRAGRSSIEVACDIIKDLLLFGSDDVDVARRARSFLRAHRGGS